MEQGFDQNAFENYLIDEFFAGNDKEEIKKLIKQRLKEDSGFKEQYELWLEESAYKSWKKFYKVLKDEEDMAWRNMFPNGDDDDSITDYLTKE
jgi:hypothetical protein